MPQPQKTNSEIEIKLPVTDPHTTIRAIKALGATSHGRTFESNTLYDTPHFDLRNSGRLLRVRTESAAPGLTRTHSTRVHRVVLTSKAPSRQHSASRKNRRYKERAEREVVASDRPHNWPAELARLGFEPAFRYEKYRTSFRLRGLHLDLDETPVGIFLELEGRPAAIERVARALGYTPAMYIRGTYWDVYAADCRRHNRKPGNMVFPKK
ncbi:MAG: class IV adenylate cyclase [Candidatus Acidiferrales bacterium]